MRRRGGDQGRIAHETHELARMQRGGRKAVGLLWLLLLLTHDNGGSSSCTVIVVIVVVINISLLLLLLLLLWSLLRGMLGIHGAGWLFQVLSFCL